MIKKKANVFLVHHYAGEVEYDVQGFLEKNKDALEPAIEDAFSCSTNPIVSILFQKVEDPKLRSSMPVKKATLATQFKTQLGELLTALHRANPHFVRCVKPNAAKTADNFNGEMVLRQLRYAGYFLMLVFL
jgi:myosin heavy subunit